MYTDSLKLNLQWNLNVGTTQTALIQPKKKKLFSSV